MSSAKWRPFCLGLNVLTLTVTYIYTMPVQVLFQMENIECFVDLYYRILCLLYWNIFQAEYIIRTWYFWNVKDVFSTDQNNYSTTSNLQLHRDCCRD